MSEVKPADGKSHAVTGVLRVDVEYNRSTKEIDFYIIPSLNKRIILDVNFWRIFNLAPDLISAKDSPSPLLNTNKEEENKYLLIVSQQVRLAAVINFFPNYGLGKLLF